MEKKQIVKNIKEDYDLWEFREETLLKILELCKTEVKELE